jgi:hypothetical protein
LELVSSYTPAGDAEVYDLLNALEDRLGHVNSAVVLAATKVFLHLTLSMTATHQQVGEGVGSRQRGVCRMGLSGSTNPHRLYREPDG